MRSLNLWLISFICACALILALMVLPTFGQQPLAHWALNVGVWVSALVISLLYLGISLIAPSEHQRSKVVLLSTYLPTLLIGLPTGTLWGAVGHLMQVEGLEFKEALDSAGSPIYIGYSLVLIITISTALYLLRIHKQRAANSQS